MHNQQSQRIHANKENIYILSHVSIESIFLNYIKVLSYQWHLKLSSLPRKSYVILVMDIMRYLTAPFGRNQ